ncbi:carbon-nitrogen hydrolase family protein [Antarctobacter jejuensis]|uniref:carbon-nitrogen hydrolase family protein n=1 Tax=Antarctobacter jejuensis TaxID=1439938 RepID=UPI003FD19D53
MSSQDALRLLACQIDIPAMTSAEERDQHLARSAARIEAQLSQTPADIVVLPELSSIDYSRAAFSCLDVLAEPLDGASFECWRAVAQKHDTFVSYSFARKAEDGFCISIAVVNPLGELVGHYDKLHLAQYGASMEKEYFRRGDHLFSFDIKGFRLAPFICYDIRFPELARALVLNHGAEVILHCGAYFRDPSFHTWHAFATARAIENQIFFLSLNRAGQDYGDSLFCYPWMDETAGPLNFSEHDEDLRLITIDRDRLNEARETYTFLRDRRDSYDRPSP